MSQKAPAPGPLLPLASRRRPNTGMPCRVRGGRMHRRLLITNREEGRRSRRTLTPDPSPGGRGELPCGAHRLLRSDFWNRACKPALLPRRSAQLQRKSRTRHRRARLRLQAAGRDQRAAAAPTLNNADMRGVDAGQDVQAHARGGDRGEVVDLHVADRLRLRHLDPGAVAEHFHRVFLHQLAIVEPFHRQRGVERHRPLECSSRVAWCEPSGALQKVSRSPSTAAAILSSLLSRPRTRLRSAP